MNAEPGTFVEGESQDEITNPAHQSWHAGVLIVAEPLLRAVYEI